MMTREDEYFIHVNLHSKEKKKITLNNQDYNIMISSNMCRYIIIEDSDGKIYEYMEQNRNTKSEFAKRACKGERLTWKIPRDNTNGVGPRLGGWKLITDNDKPKQAEIVKTDIKLW